MKYLNTQVTFAEIPDEITLCINITGCPFQCEGCHSPELRKDIGEELTLEALDALIKANEGISCVCFMGGDDFIQTLFLLAVRARLRGLKVAWYSGNDWKDIAWVPYSINFDYIKIGHYDKNKGPLNSKTTNQRLYKRTTPFAFEDITSKFWK